MLATSLAKTSVKLEIKEITLLSAEEAMTFLTKEQRKRHEDTPSSDGYWWLRSPIPDRPGYACAVRQKDGELYMDNVDDVADVIPVLKISNMKSLGLKIGDKIQIADETWSVISDEIVWRDRSIGIAQFNKEKWLPDSIEYVPDANCYEKSDIKKSLDEWALYNVRRPNKTAQIYKLNPEPVDFDIKEITLLSEEEAKSMLTKHPGLVRRYDSWWLRTTGEPPCAFSVSGDDIITYHWINDDKKVRPALRISNLKSLNISDGDKIEVGGENWTVISDELALCDRSIGRTSWRNNMRVSTAMQYEKSDVKRFINKWALEKGVVTQENIEMFHVR